MCVCVYKHVMRCKALQAVLFVGAMYDMIFLIFFLAASNLGLEPGGEGGVESGFESSV